MKIHELKKSNTKATKTRSGRGISAGKGKTAGRGTKGQKSRSGNNIPTKFEGGQTPLNMRLHKLPGFKSTKKKKRIISLTDININFSDGEIVSTKTLEAKGLISGREGIKILANGKLTVKVEFSDVSISKNVVKAIATQKSAKAARKK